MDIFHYGSKIISHKALRDIHVRNYYNPDENVINSNGDETS